MDGQDLELPPSKLMGKSLSVVRMKGTPWKAVPFDNTIVYRRRNDIITMFKDGNDDYRVKVAPYDNHFIYRVPDHIEGWGMMCTCGGPAVLVGANVYFGQASPTVGEGLSPGELVVCMSHASDGIHMDGSS